MQHDELIRNLMMKFNNKLASVPKKGKYLFLY